jgi:hypothetical protein
MSFIVRLWPISPKLELARFSTGRYQLLYAVELMLIVSRFSQDIQLIDKQLPSALQTVVTRKRTIDLLVVFIKIY